jgi:hypothetical protein
MVEGREIAAVYLCRQCIEEQPSSQDWKVSSEPEDAWLRVWPGFGHPLSVSLCRLATPPVVRLQRVFPDTTGIPPEAIRHTLAGVVALDGVQGLMVLYSHTSLLCVLILGPCSCWASKMADRGLAAQVQGRL